MGEVFRLHRAPPPQSDSDQLDVAAHILERISEKLNIVNAQLARVVDIISSADNLNAQLAATVPLRIATMLMAEAGEMAKTGKCLDPCCNH